MDPRLPQLPSARAELPPSDRAAASSWQRTVCTQIGKLIQDGWVLSAVGGGEIDDMTSWCVELPGPPDSPYEGGTWLLSVHVPRPDYPRKSPSVAFATPIFHPNVEPNRGAICLDVLNQAWSPATTLLQVVLSIQNLLSNPNGADPYNAAAAAMMRVRCLKSQAYGPEFAAFARTHAVRHALRHVARTPLLTPLAGAGDAGAPPPPPLDGGAAAEGDEEEEETYTDEEPEVEEEEVNDDADMSAPGE